MSSQEKNKMVIESYLQTLELGTLASGEYTISVSCDTSNGEWSQPIEILTIIVSTSLGGNLSGLLYYAFSLHF